MPPVALSSQGLERGASICEREFTFIGNKSEIQCTKFQAAFISPRVRSLVQADATSDALFIDCATEGVEDKRIFELLEQLMKGYDIEPSDAEVCGLLKAATFLGNTELVKSFPDVEEDIDCQNVCSRMKKGESCGRCIDGEIQFAASHFYELDFDDVNTLTISLIERILSSTELCLRDEDSLLEFIGNMDSESPILLRHIFCQYLSIESVSAFLSLVSPANIDPLIWSSLCCRLVLPVFLGASVDPEMIRSRFIDKYLIPGMGTAPLMSSDFAMEEDKPFDGIIAYLMDTEYGFFSENRSIKITSKSLDDEWFTTDNDPMNVADFTSTSLFCSKNERCQWICWDFRRRRIRPTHYTIRASHLQSWVIEGSLDGKIWTEMDWRERQTTAAPFAVSRPMDCRFIRLTQTGENSQSFHTRRPHCLQLSAAEFFGTLYE
jgi:hypothetical protein